MKQWVNSILLNTPSYEVNLNSRQGLLAGSTRIICKKQIKAITFCTKRSAGKIIQTMYKLSWNVALKYSISGRIFHYAQIFYFFEDINNDKFRITAATSNMWPISFKRVGKSCGLVDMKQTKAVEIILNSDKIQGNRTRKLTEDTVFLNKNF